MKPLKLYRVLLIRFSYIITLNFMHQNFFYEFLVPQLFNLIFYSLIWTKATQILQT